MYDRLHHRDVRVAHQALQARPDDRLAADLPVLLGPIAAGAKPAPGGHHDGCDHAIHISRSTRYFGAESFDTLRAIDAPGINL
jgi:hypothetical protein